MFSKPGCPGRKDVINYYKNAFYIDILLFVYRETPFLKAL